MDNVIHRNFNSNKNDKKELVKKENDTQSGEFSVYGVAAGQVVGICQSTNSDGRSHLKILIKSMDGGDHVVGTFENNAEGRMHAEITTMAILRSLSAVL